MGMIQNVAVYGGSLYHILQFWPLFYPQYSKYSTLHTIWLFNTLRNI
jgi:hypothetical protein